MRVEKLLYMVRFGPTLRSSLANECVGRDLSHFREQFERLALDRPAFELIDSVKPLCTHRVGLDPTLVCDALKFIMASSISGYLKYIQLLIYRIICSQGVTKYMD
mgnify:FL=1